MKQSKKYFAMLVATLLMATSVWAGGTVTVVKKLNGTVNDAAGTVTSSVNNQQCTLTVTPAQGNYITVANITAERIIDGGSAQSRFKAPGMNNSIEVSNLDITAGPAGTTTYSFTMPDEAYDVEVVADFQSRVSIAGATVTLAATSYDYDGVAKEPAVSSVVLEEGEVTLTTDDYAVSYSNNTAAGTATVTVTGQGVYTGEATTTFTINKAALSNLTVSLTGWTYGQNANTPNVVGNMGSGTVTYTYADATVAEPSFSETVPTNAGSYTVKATVAETANYAAGEATATFTIAKADITPSVSINNWTYGDTPNEPVVEDNPGNGTVTITYQGENDDTPTATVPTNAGGYTIFVSVAETANYNSASTSREFSIEQADFTMVVIAAIADQNYTGDPVEPVVTVTFNGTPVDASEYEVNYGENNVNVGTVTVTLTSNEINFANGDESVTTTFNIVAAGVEVTAEDWTETYDGNVHEFTNYTSGDCEVIALYYASEADREAGENQIEAVVDAGTYYVKLVSGDENFTFAPVYATFVIEPKSIADEEISLWDEFDGDYTMIFNDEAIVLEGMFGLTHLDTELEANEDYTVSYANNDKVGTATVTLTGQNNYTGTRTFNFNIVRQLNITFDATRQWATYYADEDLQIPAGLKAYTVTETGLEEVTAVEISYIPQHVGVLLNYVGNIEDVPEEFLASAFEGTTQSFDNNLLEGTSTGKAVSEITEGAVYVLYNNQFVKSTTGTIPAKRAYLVLEEENGGEARPLDILIDEASGIAVIKYSTLNAHSVYDLQGRRMDNSQLSILNSQLKKGLYIVNGKKLFVK